MLEVKLTEQQLAAVVDKSSWRQPLSSRVQSESSQASRGYLEDPFLVRSFAFTIFKNNFIIAREVLQSCLLNWPKPEMFCSSDADTTPLLREPKQEM